MCGIAAIWGNIDTPTLKTMMDKTIHRGPDAEGMFVWEHLIFVKI